MGIDLTLLPIDYENGNNATAFTRLSLERRSELWEEISALPSHPIAKVTAYVRDHFQSVSNDCYGNSLVWVFAQVIASLAAHEAVQDNLTNRAIWAFLAATSPDTKIILYWH